MVGFRMNTEYNDDFDDYNNGDFNDEPCTHYLITVNDQKRNEWQNIQNNDQSPIDDFCIVAVAAFIALILLTILILIS